MFYSKILPSKCFVALLFALQFSTALSATSGRQSTRERLCSTKAIRALGVRGSKHDVAEQAKTLSQKGAIRFALRKFFCDLLMGKEKDWTRSGVGFEKKNASRQSDVARIERTFAQNSPDFPHNYSSDFHFRVFYPEEFKTLWKTFDVGRTVLLESLTRHELEGFDNPAKSASTFYTTADGKYFMKSVRTKPKIEIPGLSALALETSVEMDFFFNRVRNVLWEENYVYWTGEQREDSNQFRGAFIDYFHEMQSRKQSTYLPKFFLLFSFQPLHTNLLQMTDRPQYTTIFTVQNGLLPKGLPSIDMKFDLKGSSTNRELDESMQKNNKQPTWRDLNLIRHMPGESPKGFFPDGIELERRYGGQLRKWLELDAKFLSEHHIIDYSLLMGVHFIGPKDKSIRSKNQGIPATCKNCHKFSATSKAVSSAAAPPKKLARKNTNVGKQRMVLFIGIIDMLQAFVPAKKLESLGKQFVGSIAGKGNDVNFAFPSTHPQKYATPSVVEPAQYRARFVDYLTKIVFR